MSRRRRSDNSDEEEGSPGLAIALGIGAGIAALIGTAVVAKKVYDHVTEEQQSKQKALDYQQSASNIWPKEDVPYSLKGRPTVQPSPDPFNIPKAKAWDEVAVIQSHSNISLQDELTIYHDEYAAIDINHMRCAKEVVDDIKDAILKYFQLYFPGVVTDLEDSGSVSEELKVVRPDEFDVMIPLQVDAGCFSLVSHPEVPGFYILEQYSELNGDNTFLGNFLKDDGEGGAYLSPHKVREFFQSKIQKAINGISAYNIKAGNKGPAMLLNVTYNHGFYKTSIDFVPVLVVENTQVVAKPHPRYLQNDEKRYEKYWRASFSMKERRIISSMPRQSCHRECLKIMKAVRLNHPSQFGMLSSYVYKTLLLHMLDKREMEDWAPECLEDRFVEFLQLLHTYLTEGNLPHRFTPEVNLLEQYGGVAIGNLMYYVENVVKKKKYRSLLKKDKQPY